MRSTLVVLAGSVLLAACGPGPNVVYVPTPVPAPAPVEEPLPPVGVSIVDSEDERLLLSTNQPAYVAVFEIVPDQGVSLVYPASPRQRQAMISGSRWVSVWWSTGRDSRPARSATRWPTADRRPTVRHVYAIASYRPLRITGDSYDAAYLRSVLGSRAYRATNPYETMEALAEHFVPAQVDEDWGEDLLSMNIARPERLQVARVYCADGTIVYVREDLVRRAVCPSRSSGGSRVGSVAPRPDSVVASTGRRIITEMEPSRRPPIFRVSRPAGNGSGAGNGGSSAGDDSADNGNNGNNGNTGNQGHTDNGRHTGWTRGKGNNGTAGESNNGNGSNGNNGNGESKRPVWSRVRPQGNPVKPSTPATKPESAKPAARPENAKPESAKPATPQPEKARPENAKPSTPQPEQAKPENSKPATPQPGQAKPENAKPDSAKPESAKPAAKPANAKKPAPRGKVTAAEPSADSAASDAADAKGRRSARP